MSNDVVCNIKPKFVLLVKWLTSGIFVSCFCAFMVFCSIGIAIGDSHFSELMNFFMSICIFFVIFLLFEIIRLFFNYKNYEATIYAIYSDKIEFEEGFINHKYAVLKFSDIKEIHLSQNFIQRLAGLGSIKFITAANAVDGVSGLSFKDIENSKELYKKVKDLQSQSSD